MPVDQDIITFQKCNYPLISKSSQFRSLGIYWPAYNHSLGDNDLNSHPSPWQPLISFRCFHLPILILPSSFCFMTKGVLVSCIELFVIFCMQAGGSWGCYKWKGCSLGSAGSLWDQNSLAGRTGWPAACWSKATHGETEGRGEWHFFQVK